MINKVRVSVVVLDCLVVFVGCLVDAAGVAGVRTFHIPVAGLPPQLMHWLLVPPLGFDVDRCFGLLPLFLIMLGCGCRY